MPKGKECNKVTSGRCASNMRYNKNSGCGKWNKAKTKKSCVPKTRTKKTKTKAPPRMWCKNRAV